MGAVEPARPVQGHELNSADHARAILDLLEDSVEERQQLKDTQLAVLNTLEDATADRLKAEAAVKASLDILEDLNDAQAEIRTLNADLEARVEQRTAELVTANKNLEAFTYSVAHDLRSPLRALSGYSEALTRGLRRPSRRNRPRVRGRIQAASERMAALIDDLLLLAQVSRTDMNLEPVDLSAEVAAIAGELQAGEPGRRVRFAIQDGVWVTADRTLIRTVVQNLIENAWKFTARRDDATIEFGTTAAPRTPESAATCATTGPASIPPYADKLFQPFQRLHAVTEFPGTGIGLASVQRIIERHGGRVWAEGAVGRGATFYFTLGTKPASEVVSEVVSGVSARKP